MSSLAIGDPIDVLIGHPWLFVVSWLNPDGSPVDTSGMAIAASIGRYDPATSLNDLAPLVYARNDSGGAVTLALTASDTLGVPPGQLSTLQVSWTDTAGQDHVFEAPVRGRTRGDASTPVSATASFGAVGAQGPAGPPSKGAIHWSSGPPDDAVGGDGDFWVDTSVDPAGFFGPKQAGQWPDVGWRFSADHLSGRSMDFSDPRNSQFVPST